MQLSNLNLLVMLDKALGVNPSQLLQDIQNLPVEGNALLRARVAQLLPGGSAQLELAGGGSFQAKLPVNLPQDSRLLLQVVQQMLQNGQTAQAVALLRYQLPGEADEQTAAQIIQNAADDVVNMTQPQNTAPNQLPKVGAKVTFTTDGPRPPAPGATVIGKVTTAPQNGEQTLQLANGTKLVLPNPPVFAPRSEITLTIGQKGTATLTAITPPEAGEAAPTPQQATHTQQTAAQNTTPPASTPKAAPRPQATAPQAAPAKASQPAPVTQPQAPRAAVKPAISLPPQGLPVTLNRPLTQAQGSQITLTGHYSPSPANPNSGVLLLDDNTAVEITTPTPLPAGRVSLARADDGIFKLTPPQPAATTEPRAQSLVATVVSSKPGGHMQLKLPGGRTIDAMSQRQLPVGTQITLRPTDDGLMEIVGMSLPKGDEALNQLLKFALQWDTLDQTVATLKDQNPPAYQAFKASLPQPGGPDTVIGLIKAFDAIADKSLNKLFGDDNVQTLQQMGVDSRMSSDLTHLSTLHQAPQQSQPQQDFSAWRVAFFPFWDEVEDKPKQGSFYWRRQKNPQGQGTADHLVRFVLGLQLSNLGSIQLDGLVSKHKMTLRLRTLENLGQPFEEELQKIVEDALRKVDMQGQIKVESVSFFEVDPLADIMHNQSHLRLDI